MCAAILPGGYVVRHQIRGETAPLWHLCKNVEWETVENGDKPYCRIDGEIQGLTEEQLDSLCHEKLRGWIRTRHMGCFGGPICYIDNRTGTRIEFGSFLFNEDTMRVKEVRWLSTTENLAYQANSKLFDRDTFHLPDSLQPGPVSSGGCWVQPYGTKW